MSTQWPHEEIEGLLGAYALDAVGVEEAAAIERHLEGCPRCRDEADSLRELAGKLGTSAAVEIAEVLPTGLWERIAGSLESRPRPFQPPAPAGLGPFRAPEAVPAPAAAGRRHPGPRRPSPRSLRWASMAVAAAAVVAIALLGINLSQVDGQLGRTQRALAGRGQDAAVQAALADPSHRVVRLDSTEGTELAEFVVVPSGQGYMVSSSMPALPSDETYQLWAVVSGQPISMGLLGNLPRRASFTLAPGAGSTELAVTVEPAGGVTTPDRSPVATGSLT